MGESTSATILVVDDTPANVRLLNEMLSHAGYVVVTACSGEEALEKVAAVQPDLVLLDVMMPGIDGYEVCRRLRAGAGTQLLPVVMVTSSDSPNRVLAIEAGADDFLMKPVDRHELVARVRSLLRIKSFHDQIQQQARELLRLNTSLEERVNHQVEQLERAKRLRRFLPPQLADMLLSAGGESILQSHRRQIAVVCCRLTGFTTFAETTAPEEAIAVLDEYHQVLGDLIDQFGGTVGSFVGDRIMVFFNDPVPCADPAVRAARLVLAARSRVEGLAQNWSKRGHQLGFAAAITLGFATLGQLALRTHVDYGAVGPVVTQCERLCEVAEAGTALMTAPVFAAVEEIMAADDVGEIELKDFVRPVAVVQLIGERSRNGTAADEPTSGLVDRLSLREREVAVLVARGLTNRQIADELVISERTAEGHLERLRDKLGVHNRAEIAVWAIQNGLVSTAGE